MLHVSEYRILFYPVPCRTLLPEGSPPSWATLEVGRDSPGGGRVGTGRRRAGTTKVVLSWVLVCAQPGPAALAAGRFCAPGALTHLRRGRCGWAGPTAWRAAGPGAQRRWGRNAAPPCSVCPSREPPLKGQLAFCQSEQKRGEGTWVTQVIGRLCSA